MHLLDDKLQCYYFHFWLINAFRRYIFVKVLLPSDLIHALSGALLSWCYCHCCSLTHLSVFH